MKKVICNSHSFAPLKFFLPYDRLGEICGIYWQRFDGLTFIFGGQSNFLVRESKSAIKTNESWNYVIFTIHFLNYYLSNTYVTTVKRNWKRCATMDLIVNTCTKISIICFLVWCAGLSGNVEGDKSKSYLQTLFPSFFTHYPDSWTWLRIRSL